MATITPVSLNVGAEVSDIDVSVPLDDETVEQLRRALGEYGVLFFRQQDLTEAQHIALAERFGTIDVNRFFTPVPDHGQIAEVRKEADQEQNIGGGWHTDHSYDEEPAMGSLLYARILPSIGGDTLFASMHAAYAALSEGLKETLRQLRAVHSSRHVFGATSAYTSATAGRLQNAEAATQDSIHPIVVEHPISGKPVLYVNSAFTIQIEGWTPEESQALLQLLYKHAQRPEFTYRFHWEPRSLAFWDNRATWHYALNDYHGHQRLMHRVTVAGEPLVAAAAG